MNCLLNNGHFSVNIVIVQSRRLCLVELFLVYMYNEIVEIIKTKCIMCEEGGGSVGLFSYEKSVYICFFTPQ